MSLLKVGQVSHKGPKQVNEDAGAISKRQDAAGNNVVLAIIADGLGGYEAGDVASTYVVNELKNWFNNHLDANEISFQKVSNDLQALFFKMNDYLIEMKNNKQIQLGTTCSALFMYRGRYVIKHVGDSRIYLLKQKRLFSGTWKNDSKRLQQLTEDHSWVQSFVDDRQLTKEQARLHPKRNVLTQCIGVEQKLAPFTVSGEYSEEDYFLLCSDGFHELYSEDVLAEMLIISSQKSDAFQATADAALVHCLSNSKLSDNVTLLLVQDTRAESKKDKLNETFHKLFKMN